MKIKLPSVALLSAGKVMAALVLVASIPIVARLYSPSDFGIASMVVAIAATVAPVSMLGLEKALLSEREDQAISALVMAAIKSLLSASLLVAGVAVIVVMARGGLNAQSEDMAFLLTPVVLMSSASCLLFENLAVRRNRDTHLAASELLQAGGGQGARIGLGVVLGSSAIWILCSAVIGSVAKTALLMRVTSQSSIVEVVQYARRHRCSFVLGRYRQFVRYAGLADLVRTATRQGPTLLIGALLAPAATGYFVMASRLAVLPQSLVGEVIRKVFLRAGGHREKTEQVKLFFRLQRRLLWVALPIATVCVFWSPTLIIFLLGPEWSEAARIFKALIPMYFLLWVSVPATAMFQLFSMQDVWLRFQVLNLTTQAIFVTSVALLTQDLHMVVAAVVMVQVLMSGLYLLFINRMALRILGQRKPRTSMGP